MIFLPLLPVFSLLWQPENTFTLSRSLVHPYCSSISFRLPFPFEANCCGIDGLFKSLYNPSAVFIEKFDLEVREFSLGGDKRGYAIEYCESGRIPSLSKVFNISQSMNDEGRFRSCKYALFADKKWFEYVNEIDEQDMRHLRQLFNTGVQGITFNLFTIANSSTRKFPVLRWDCNKGNSHLRLKINVDESNFPNTLFLESLETSEKLGYHRFNKAMFLSAIVGILGGLFAAILPCLGGLFAAIIPILGGFFAIGKSLAGLFVLSGRSLLCMFIDKAKKIKHITNFFKRNGCSLLQQMLNSHDGSVDRCKLFDAKDLDKATDHFNVSRILGEGGQGAVYKGTLEDGRIIAVKKSKVVDEEKLQEFINELVILSQINHRNVVKLLGYCLETKVPLLVYEFIPNGSLSQYIHHYNEEFQLTWEMRLRIATEVARALFYLHSLAATPIYHRDIKSTNILLDEEFRVKVGDFGISKFIAIDQTHVSTVVLGTLGYLDPEYYQSSQLTDKSDVYSYGVVLVELLTGEKPIFSLEMEENINLAKYFIHAMKKNRLHDILDDQMKRMGKKEEIMAFANLAKRCLSMKGKERPTMKEVATELERIRALKKKKGMVSKIMKYFSRPKHD